MSKNAENQNNKFCIFVVIIELISRQHKLFMIKRVIYIIFFIIILFASNSGAYASHYMGGEITWECKTNGKYRFILKLYRECAGINYSPTESLVVTNNPFITNINMTLVSQTDISPDCNTAYPNIQCNPPPVPSNTGAVEEWLYTSDASYPNGVTLTGVPPPQGWIFSHTGCCRNPCTNILNSSGLDWFLRAVMYPYNGQNTNPCFDNSPTFAEKPSTVICTGYPFTYNHNAWDTELDSLAFEWAPPLEAANTPITAYAPGYNFTNPLPGPTFNPNNVQATVNSYTGEISFTSFTQGAFVTVTKVTAYKCGIKVAEIFREMQIVLLPCGSNSPPVVTAPFPDLLGNYIYYSDTVYAGALVTFYMSGADYEYLPNGNGQTVHLFASGSQFGANFTSTTTGCLNPPCATLSPPPPISAPFGVSTNFSWQTDCDHLATNIGCGSTSNIYNFLIKMQDDFCPAPAISIKTITIVVLTTPVLPPPDLRCASVDATGNVTLTWIPPIDTMNSFNSYHIYSSTSPSGPFIVADSIFNINQTSYTHIGANANTQSLYYYIKTRSGCYGTHYSSPSDTLQTILLNVVNSGIGTAVLTWNPLHNPNLPTSLGWYHIYREYPPGIWTLIDSTQSLSYLDSITLCNALINYYVDIDDSLGCSSRSSIDGDLFQDIIAPSTPVIDSVTVDSLSGRSVITWHSSSSSDTQGYIIYENINGIWVPIDTIWGLDITTYTNIHPTWANPDSTSLSYCVAAFDSCQNTSPISSNHNTIYLTSNLNVCDGEVTLNWTPYVNMHPGLMGYRIYVKENNGPVTLLGTNTATNLSFIHSSLTQSSEYIYCIQAFDSSGVVTSTSNTDTIVVHMPVQPQYAYLRYATVANNDHVKINCFIDIAAYISKCKIMRSDDAIGPFTQISMVSPNLTPFITYDDYSVYVNKKSYYYKVIVVDSCGNDVLTSNIGRSIYLRAEPLNDMTNTLTWNEYEDWLGGVSTYNLYRKVDEVWDPTTLVTLSSTSITYIDDVSDFTSTNGKFGYMIEAIEGVGNPYLFSDTSLSNEAVALQPPRFYVPNAFVPESINNIFIPLNVFVDPEDYQFSIFNRWGQVVFQTSDPKAGWDGTANGYLSPQGVYVYIIKYKNSQNKYIEKRGTVTLLR